MESLSELYKIGKGPSSSHTMGPEKAAKIFLHRTPGSASYKVILFGSLAATRKGHLTDDVLKKTFHPYPIQIEFIPEISLSEHPNTMRFIAMDGSGIETHVWDVVSIGGGSIIDIQGQLFCHDIYPLTSMCQIISWCDSEGKQLWHYVLSVEPEIMGFLDKVWDTMQSSIQEGLDAEGVLPGGLELGRKARSYFQQAEKETSPLLLRGKLHAYALAVAEMNASGGTIVTAPTCGSSGVVPSVLRYLQEKNCYPKERILEALAVAGLVGNLVKANGSISGADVGCQGEIGVACSMAAAAAVYLLGGTVAQSEYAAEMGIEHHLGMTCDPVQGLVQIPCIERNAIAAARALDCALHALLSDGRHRFSFDDIVKVMVETGRDLPSGYRETAMAGMARHFQSPKNPKMVSLD